MRLVLPSTCVAYVLCGLVAGSAVSAQEHAEDMLIGSSAAGGGQLKIEWDWDEIFVTPIGSAGGVTFHTSTDPGFEALDHDDPEDGIYQLLSGTDVHFRVTAIEPGVSVTIRGNTLDAVGQTALIGTLGGSPGLHHHPTWALSLPTGMLDERTVSFELFSTSSAYSASDVYTATLTNIPEPATLGVLGVAGAVMVTLRGTRSGRRRLGRR